jgi:hypothetical protein
MEIKLNKFVPYNFDLIIKRVSTCITVYLVV